MGGKGGGAGAIADGGEVRGRRPGWKCCKPRVLTFDEFMSIPPCTAGTHSTTDKPAQLEEKPAEDEAALARKMAALGGNSSGAAPARVPVQPAQQAPETDDDDPGLKVADGTECRRRTCGQRYRRGSAREGERCVHHPGVPIFHEGSKGYSCCKRRVLEFDQFLKIEGCKTRDRHLFIGSGRKKTAGAGSSGDDEVLDSVR